MEYFIVNAVQSLLNSEKFQALATAVVMYYANHFLSEMSINTY